MNPRIIYITTCKDSIDPNNLTHIALFEYYADKNPVAFIEKSHADKLQVEVDMLRKQRNNIADEFDKQEYEVGDEVLARMDAEIKAELEKL